MKQLMLIEEIASDKVIDEAYRWLTARRKDYSANNDVWRVRRKWDIIKPQLQRQLLAGDYRFDVVERLRGNGRTVLLWSSFLFYARFMDDWVILSPTRWKLRKAIKLVNQILAELKVEKHPEKTFIGRISRGFDFLGDHFTRWG